MTLLQLYEKVTEKIPDLLLPCPACDDSWYYISDNTYGADYENKGVTVCCQCGIAQRLGYFKTKEVAAKNWNHKVINKIQYNHMKVG